MKTVRKMTRKIHKNKYLQTINYNLLKNETIYNKLQSSQYSPQPKRKFAFQQSGRGSKVTNDSVLRSSAAEFCCINAKWTFFCWSDSVIRFMIISQEFNRSNVNTESKLYSTIFQKIRSVLKLTPLNGKQRTQKFLSALQTANKKSACWCNTNVGTV